MKKNINNKKHSEEKHSKMNRFFFKVWSANSISDNGFNLFAIEWIRSVLTNQTDVVSKRKVDAFDYQIAIHLISNGHVSFFLRHWIGLLSSVIQWMCWFPTIIELTNCAQLLWRSILTIIIIYYYLLLIIIV